MILLAQQNLKCLDKLQYNFAFIDKITFILILNYAVQ